MHIATDIHAVSVDLSASCFVSLSIFPQYRSHAVSVSKSVLEYHNALFPPRPSPLTLSLPFFLVCLFPFRRNLQCVVAFFASVLYMLLIHHQTMRIPVSTAPLSCKRRLCHDRRSLKLDFLVMNCSCDAACDPMQKPHSPESSVVRYMLVPRQTILKWKRRKRERRDGGKRWERELGEVLNDTGEWRFCERIYLDGS